MDAITTRSGLSWSARLLIGLTLILIGAGATVWGLSRSERAARFLGLSNVPAQAAIQPQPSGSAGVTAPAIVPPQPAFTDARVAGLEARIARVENATQRAEGSAGRADALVVAFAARRAIDRGVALGYLENVLVDRFGAQYPRAVGTIVSASHQPVRLNDLISDYEALGPDLRRGGPQDSWWDNFTRSMGSLIEVHRADRPARSADARYNRAMQRLAAGDVDQALAETMRLPGATRAGPWIEKARRYVAAHRALDEIESAALLGGSGPAATR
jgi:hypothetical protein